MYRKMLLQSDIHKGEQLWSDICPLKATSSWGPGPPFLGAQTQAAEAGVDALV